MPEPENPEARRVLTTWKEIASFFSREVRTVQRWEKEEGLPVHRHLHQRQSSVYAYPDELEAWWQHRGAALSQTANGENGASWPAWLKWAGGAAAVVVVVAALWATFGVRHSAGEPEPLPAVTLDGTRPNAFLAVSLVGDVNGDGFNDQVFSGNVSGETYIRLGGKAAVSGELPQAADVLVTTSLNGSLYAAQLGDFNGDGLGDLLFSGNLNEPDMLRDNGPSFIVFGRKAWPRQIQLPANADVTLRFTALSDPRSSGCLFSDGPADLDGDGLTDVLLASPDWSSGDRRSPGGIHILRGRKQWPREVDVFADADITIVGSRTGEGLGTPCKVGDFNGDGRPDLALTASESTLWNLLGGKGRTYLFLGRPKWPSFLDAKTDSTLVIEGTTVYGQGILAFADVNGDGKDDLAVAGGTDHPLRIWFGTDNPQRSYSPDSADVSTHGPDDAEQLGCAVAAKDIDNDGITDLLLSDPVRGTILLLAGRTNWKKDGTLAELGPSILFSGEKGTGMSQISVGDTDGDGLPEIGFTNPRYGSGARHAAGRAWILKPYIPAKVDVRPGSEPNIVYFPDGVVVARLAGTRGAAQVDPQTARLAGVLPERYLFRDEDGDGIEDLTMHFPTRKMRITPETTRVIFTARTRDGRLLAGSDVVEVIVQSATAGSSGGANGNH